MRCAGHLSGARLGARHWFDSRGQMKPVSRPFLSAICLFSGSTCRRLRRCGAERPFSRPPRNRNNKVSRRKIKPGRGQLETNGMLGGPSKLVCSQDHGPVVSAKPTLSWTQGRVSISDENTDYRMRTIGPRDNQLAKPGPSLWCGH